MHRSADTLVPRVNGLVLRARPRGQLFHPMHRVFLSSRPSGARVFFDGDRRTQRRELFVQYKRHMSVAGIFIGIFET